MVYGGIRGASGGYTEGIQGYTWVDGGYLGGYTVGIRGYTVGIFYRYMRGICDVYCSILLNGCGHVIPKIMFKKTYIDLLKAWHGWVISGTIKWNSQKSTEFTKTLQQVGVCGDFYRTSSPWAGSGSVRRVRSWFPLFVFFSFLLLVLLFLFCDLPRFVEIDSMEKNKLKAVLMIITAASQWNMQLRLWKEHHGRQEF